MLTVLFSAASPNRREPLLHRPFVRVNGGMLEAVRGSMHDVLEHLTNIGFPEDEIIRLGTEYIEAGHTVLRTDKIIETNIRRALDPPGDIVKALREAALAELEPSQGRREQHGTH